MLRQFDHVSAERALSGPGLVNLYNALAAVEGVPPRGYTPAQITDPEIGAADPLCAEATELFCAMLGTVAGNLALTLGARGGIYIGAALTLISRRFRPMSSPISCRPFSVVPRCSDDERRLAATLTCGSGQRYN
jgi:glucokinase